MIISAPRGTKWRKLDGNIFLTRRHIYNEINVVRKHSTCVLLIPERNKPKKTRKGWKQIAVIFSAQHVIRNHKFNIAQSPFPKYISSALKGLWKYFAALRNYISYGTDNSTRFHSSIISVMHCASIVYLPWLIAWYMTPP